MASCNPPAPPVRLAFPGFTEMLSCVCRDSFCIESILFACLEFHWGAMNGPNIEACLPRSTCFGLRVVSGSKSVGGSDSPGQRGFAAFGSDHGWRLEPARLQRP